MLLAHLVAVLDGGHLKSPPDQARSHELPHQHGDAERAADRPGTLHQGSGSTLKLRESRLVRDYEGPVLQVRPMNVDVTIER